MTSLGRKSVGGQTQFLQRCKLVIRRQTTNPFLSVLMNHVWWDNVSPSQPSYYSGSIENTTGKEFDLDTISYSNAFLSHRAIAPD